MAVATPATGSVYFTVVPDTIGLPVVNTMLLPTTFTADTGLLVPPPVTVNAPGKGILVVLSGSL